LCLFSCFIFLRHLPSFPTRRSSDLTLHQDLYGDLFFPVQMVLFLNEPDEDYSAGEFVLTQQIPRAQTRAIVLRPKRGDALIFARDRKSTRLNSSHVKISYAVFCLKK